MSIEGKTGVRGEDMCPQGRQVSTGRTGVLRGADVHRRGQVSAGRTGVRGRAGVHRGQMSVMRSRSRPHWGEFGVYVGVGLRAGTVAEAC